MRQIFTLALEKPEVSKGRTYNISEARSYTYQEVYNTIAELLDREPPTIHLPASLAKVVAFKVESVNRLIGREDFMWHTSTVDSVTSNRAYSIEKAVRELGYNPCYVLKNGLRETIEWYKKQGII